MNRLTILTLLLTLVTGCSSTPPAAANPARAFSGRATGYTQGNAEMMSITNNGQYSLGEGTIKPNGDFEFTYVGTPPAAALYGVADETLFCPELLPASTSVRLFFDNYFDVFVAGKDLSVGYVIAASSRAAYTDARGAGDSMLYRVYVTDDLTIKGNCSSKVATLSYEFKKGWNVALRSFVDNGALGIKEEARTVTQIPATNWFYQDYPAQ